MLQTTVSRVLATKRKERGKRRERGAELLVRQVGERTVWRLGLPYTISWFKLFLFWTHVLIQPSWWEKQEYLSTVFVWSLVKLVSSLPLICPSQGIRRIWVQGFLGVSISQVLACFAVPSQVQKIEQLAQPTVRGLQQGWWPAPPSRGLFSFRQVSDCPQGILLRLGNVELHGWEVDLGRKDLVKYWFWVPGDTASLVCPGECGLAWWCLQCPEKL